MRIYEINTAVWLAGRRFDAVPATEWDAIAALPVDAIWLMGVWERSPAGLAIALEDPGLMAGMRAALPDLTEADVIGSPYCVRAYVVDPRFGSLSVAREALAARGLKLILDYVPNHVAPDHPWVPEHCIHGSEDDLARDPASWLRVGDAIVARGRDPYFPAWPDVVQLDAFSPALRAEVRDLLARLAGICDGVRCDMAMLMTSEVFARTWGRTPPASEFWPDVIDDDLIFIAEAYWDMEYALHRQGFDYAYDKRLYDRLRHEDAASVRAHLAADGSYLLRFVENHDEPRAATAFGERARAAAVILATVPGGKLYHDGQLEGARTHIPVFLARGPLEAPDLDLWAFYARLLRIAPPRDWRLLDTDHPQLLAWSFTDHIVAVNFGPAEVWGRVHVRVDGTLTDLLTDAVYERSGDELVVGLPAWGAHVFSSQSSS
jgi:hypothetical protein